MGFDAIEKLKQLTKFFVVTPIPTIHFTQTYYNPFINESWNFGNQSPILFSVMGDFFKSAGDSLYSGNTYIYAASILTIFGLYLIRQEDTAVPLFMLFIMSNVLFWTPGILPTWIIMVIQGCMAVMLGAYGYLLWKGRRVS